MWDFLERTYVTETITQGALLQFIAPTELIQPLPTQLPWKHTRSAATGATTLVIQYWLAVHVTGIHLNNARNREIGVKHLSQG